MAEPDNLTDGDPRPSKSALRATLRRIRQRRAQAMADTSLIGRFRARHYHRENRELCQRLLDYLARMSPQSIAFYMPLAGEADLRLAMIDLHKRGWTVLLPCIEGDEKKLRFRQWHPNHPLLSGKHGILQPDTDAPEQIPETIILPLLGFDKRGQRLGMGAGWYDRTIASLRATGHLPLLVGVGFDEQEVNHVPDEPHDQPLERIITGSRALIV